MTHNDRINIERNIKELEFIRRVKDSLGLRFKRLKDGTIKVTYVKIIDEIDPTLMDSFWPEIGNI